VSGDVPPPPPPLSNTLAPDEIVNPNQNDRSGVVLEQSGDKMKQSDNTKGKEVYHVAWMGKQVDTHVVNPQNSGNSANKADQESLCLQKGPAREIGLGKFLSVVHARSMVILLEIAGGVPILGIRIRSQLEI
jgi:hypothetical protein